MEIAEWSPENPSLPPAATSELPTVKICKDHVSIADNESCAPVVEAPPSAAFPPRNAPEKWAVDLPRLLVPTNLTLEKFHLLKWQEIFRLSRILASPCFRRVRLAGDDHALYECFHRSFPHEMVAKARFTGVARAVLGVEGAAGVHSALSQEAHALCRHLDKMQYVFELSGDNVPMLNWRLLLVGLHLFQYPLLPLREHIAWGFRVFASVGFLDALADSTTICTSDLALLLSQLMRNQACRRLVADRLRQAQVLLSTGPLTPANVRQRMHATRVSHRRFQDLVALEPLRVLFEKATDHTVVLEEMATPLYRERVFRKRKKDADCRKIDRLRFFHRTRRLRGAYVGWHDAARALRRTRAIIIAAFRRLTRAKKTHAFTRLKRHAIESWAATEIQRMTRGLRGRRLASDQWTLVQAAIRVQGAFRMRSHFLRFTNDVRRRHRAAIHVQRVYRGWAARVVARTTLLAYYYQEMEKLERDREELYGVVRREMARRIQRLFRRIVARQRDARAAREALERLRIEHEMEDVASEATRHMRRHKADVTAKYAALREAHEYKQRRKQLDGIEKAKVIRLRRQRQWDAFKAERLAIRERQKRDAADAHSALQAEWEARNAERVKAKRLFLSQVVDLEEPGEWKALQRQLRALISEREKELQLKYRQSQVAVAKRDVHERATIEVIDDQVEQERRTAEAEWLKAEADFFYDQDVQEEERAMAENAEHRKRRDKSAVRVQSAFRMFAARKLLKQEIRQCFVKEFDPKTQLALYRNTFTQERPKARKPFGLGSDDLEFADQWVLVADDVAGQSFFYHPQTLRQQWEPPDECQCCSVCAMASEPAAVFAAYWNADEDSYFCKSCHGSRLAQGELDGDRYFPYDGSKRGGY